MSVPFDPSILTRRTDADMSTKEWHLVKPVGDNDMDLTGLNDLPIGAMTNDVADGSTDAVFLPVQIGGIIKVKCGGIIDAGNLAGSDANGQAVQVSGAHGGATNSHAFGIALETYAAGDIGAFLWAPSYLSTT